MSGPEGFRPKASTPETAEQRAESTEEKLRTEAARTAAEFSAFESDTLVPESARLSKTEKVCERAESGMRKIVRVVLAASLGIAIGESSSLGIQYEKTVHQKPAPRYRITTKKDHHGHIRYSHEDTETTAILNWLTGYGPAVMPVEYKEMVEKENLEDFITQPKDPFPGPVPANLESMTGKALEQFKKDESMKWAMKYHPHDPRLVKIDYELGLEAVAKGTGTFKHNPELYKKLWQLQIQVGAPMIRWASQDELLPSSDTEVSKHHRAYYRSYNNTVYLAEPRDVLGDIVAEDSHAEQYVNRNGDARKEEAGVEIEEYGRMLNPFHPLTKLQAHDTTYDEPGSLEYNAHKEIEPELWKKLGKSRPKAQ